MIEIRKVKSITKRFRNEADKTIINFNNNEQYVAWSIHVVSTQFVEGQFTDICKSENVVDSSTCHKPSMFVLMLVKTFNYSQTFRKKP